MERKWEKTVDVLDCSHFARFDVHFTFRIDPLVKVLKYDPKKFSREYFNTRIVIDFSSRNSNSENPYHDDGLSSDDSSGIGFVA